MRETREIQIYVSFSNDLFSLVHETNECNVQLNRSWSDDIVLNSVEWDREQKSLPYSELHPLLQDEVLQYAVAAVIKNSDIRFYRDWMEGVFIENHLNNTDDYLNIKTLFELAAKRKDIRSLITDIIVNIIDELELEV